MAAKTVKFIMRPATYEPGMDIAFDPKARKVTVSFRGRVTAFPTMLENEADARMAAEAYCRERGWDPETIAPLPRGRG
ncbi:MAG: hypothetical protein AB7E79_01190 [Rhodospirillaceae bacterium]